MEAADPHHEAVPARRVESPLEHTLRANVRVPEQVLGDIHAQLAANPTGGRRLLGLMDERPLDERHLEDLMLLAEVLHARSEAAEQVYRVAINAERWEVGVERTRALRE